MKKITLVLVILLMASIVFLSGCIGPEQGVKAIKFYGKPYSFVNMSEEQMNHFPHLKESILTNKSIYMSSPSQEITELQGILQYFDTDYIYYQEDYYEIEIIYAD